MKVHFLSGTRASLRVGLALLVFCSVVMARDLDQDEALRLRQQGWIAIQGPNCWKPSLKKNTTSTFMKSNC